jgi:hypothetical protein
VAGQSPGCHGGSATNPRAAIASDGSVYVIANVDGGTRVNVTRDGRTWLYDEATCDAALSPCAIPGGNGTPWIATDPRDARTAYALADAFGDDSSSGLVTRTTDAGATWSDPAPAAPAASGTANVLGQLFVLGDGSVVDVFAQCDNTPVVTCRVGDGVVKAIRSTDGTRTWTPVPAAGVALPVESAFDAAVDRTGTIYIAYAAPSGAGWAVQLNRSLDGGRTWSAPATAVETALRPTHVTLAVTGDGRLGVTYVERGTPGLGGAVPYEVWFAASRAGEPWQRSRLAGPTDFASMPMVNPHLGDLEAMAIGEWQGLVGLPHGFAAAFPLGAPQATIGPTDVFFARR